jgi:hypothetical protein
MVQLRKSRKATAKGVQCLAVAVAGFVLMGAPAAHAGTSGQQLSLHDVHGNYNSAIVSGYNQNCQYVDYRIPYWRNRDYNIRGWWWRGPYTCRSPAYAQPFRVQGCSQYNYGNCWDDSDLSRWDPPVSQWSSDWTTCAVDNAWPVMIWNPYGCTPGREAFG